MLSTNSLHPFEERHLTHPKYRPDIDGLRAIAILAVVGFHAFPNWVKGGFIGVDIFFVISGYLISTIIYGSLDRNSFSFIEFYVRRIRRIFPALILVLASCFIFGWFTLLADEYKQLGKHTAGGAGFISNFLLWNESGYFDNLSETKPLLHLWSLGIEEQYYIAWPLLLWFAWKQRLNLLTFTILIGAISFYLNINAIGSDAVAVFYAPQTRFWELLVGSLLAYITLYQKNHPSVSNHNLDAWFDKWIYPAIYSRPPEANSSMRINLQSLLGVALIVLGIFIIAKTRAFPGWWACLPTAGAVLIISAGKQAWLNRVVLSNRLLVWVGLISFPLYLWHWPLLSFARIVEGETPSPEIRILAVLLSIALAWLTYKFIEKPFRFGGQSKWKTIVLIALMVVVGLAGYYSYKQDGLPFRSYSEKFQSYAQSIVGDPRQSECFEILHAFEKKDDWFCSLGDKAIAPSYFAYGDSHALNQMPALERYASDYKLNILFTGSSGCPPLLGVQSMRGVAWTDQYNCQKLNERIFNYVKDNGIKSVLLMARWTYYIGGTTRPSELNPISMDVTKKSTKEFSKISFEVGLKKTIERYKKIGVQVYLFDDTPQQLYDPKDALKKSRPPNDSAINQLSVSTKEHMNNQLEVSEKFRSIYGEVAGIVNLDDVLCNKDICPLVSNGKFIYLDDDHLTVNGAMMGYSNIVKVLSPAPLDAQNGASLARTQ